MRKTIAIITVAFLMVSVAGVHSGAVSFKNQEVVPYSEKIPIETPHFKPILDCVWDEDYQTKYIIKETEKLFHEGTYISTAWYENTLYFYLFVPDTSPQEEPYNIANYMADGPWFALYFGGDLRGKMMWKGNRNAKTFKILPYVERIIYQGACFEESVAPPRDEDFQFDLEYREDGYVLELAYTVPTDVSCLHGNQEIAFDIEIYDVNEGMGYRYFLANHSIDAFENYCSAWGAKLVLETYAGEETDYGSSTETETETDKPGMSDETETQIPGVVSESVPDSYQRENSKTAGKKGIVLSVISIVLLACASAAIISARGKKETAGSKNNKS